MRRRWKTLCSVAVITCMLAACGSDTNTVQTEDTTNTEQTNIEANQQLQETGTEEIIDAAESGSTETESIEPENTETEASGSKVLVAYFTRLPNTESGDDLDAVVQGGGPYGAIGDSFENADMDAISSASITVTEEGVKGNVQTVAEWIAEHTGADLFSIETVEKYPLDYDTLIDQGGEERQNNVRPELATHVENIDNYEIIYLGYPNWYYDMPMALYTFLEEYDLSGKTIIPFATSAGSGLSSTVSTIAELEPEAEVIEDALALRMGAVRTSETEVINWVDGLGIQP